MAQLLRRHAAKKAILLLFTSVTVVLAVPRAYAAENIEIPSDGVKVYAKSDIASQVIGVLNKGTVVPAATNPVGNFRKVMIVVSGKKLIGYINQFDMRGEVKVVTAIPPKAAAPGPSPMPAQGKIQQQQRPVPTPDQLRSQQNPQAVAAQQRARQVRRTINYGLHHRSALGLMLGVNYQNQGPTQYSCSGGSTCNVGTLTGTDPMFGLSLAFPLNYRISIEPYVLYKQISVTGTVSPAFGGPTQPAAFILAQTYLSLGAVFRVYSSLSSYLWYGGGLQIDHGLSGTFQIGTATPIPAQQGDLPNLIMAYGIIGVDFKLSKNLFLVPDLRLGAVVNTSPPIFEVDGYASIKLAL